MCNGNAHKYYAIETHSYTDNVYMYVQQMLETKCTDNQGCTVLGLCLIRSIVTTKPLQQLSTFNPAPTSTHMNKSYFLGGKPGGLSHCDLSSFLL